MIRLALWLSAATFALYACSGNHQRSTHSQPGNQANIESGSDSRYPRPERTLECPGASTEWPDKSDQSQRAFCTMFAHSIALCEAPFDGPSCQRIAWEDKRATQLTAECMSQDIDAIKVPLWIESLFACSYGDDYDAGEYFMFPCPDRYPCWRSIGMSWTPAPDARQYPRESL